MLPNNPRTNSSLDPDLARKLNSFPYLGAKMVSQSLKGWSYTSSSRLKDSGQMSWPVVGPRQQARVVNLVRISKPRSQEKHIQGVSATKDDLYLRFIPGSEKLLLSSTIANFFPQTRGSRYNLSIQLHSITTGKHASCQSSTVVTLLTFPQCA
jgi:hypothetical protein